MVESMQQSSATPSLHLGFLGLRKIVACSQPYLAVASCTYSFWHGVIPTSYFIFNDFYTCIIYKCKNEVGCRDDIVPKTVKTRRRLRACNNLPQLPPYILVFGGCGRLLNALNLLLVLTVFGTISSLHPTSFYTMM